MRAAADGLPVSVEEDELRGPEPARLPELE